MLNGKGCKRPVALMSIGALAVGGSLAGMAGVAGAATTPASLSSIQAKAAAAITLRVNDLNAAVAKVNGNTKIGSSGPALAAYVGDDVAGLQSLGQTIAADTTVTAARTDAKTIYTNYRVFLLVLPAARLAGASDEIGNWAVPKLTTESAKLAGRVNPGNQATIAPLLSDLNAQISAAGSAVSGVSSTVLAYTPAQLNADRSLLSGALSDVATGRAAIKSAEGYVKQIVSDLKSEHSASTTAGAAGGTTTTTS